MMGSYEGAAYGIHISDTNGLNCSIHCYAFTYPNAGVAIRVGGKKRGLSRNSAPPFIWAV